MKCFFEKNMRVVLRIDCFKVMVMDVAVAVLMMVGDVVLRLWK